MAKEAESPQTVEIPSELISTDEEESPISLTDTLEIGQILEYLRRAAKHHHQYNIGDIDGNQILGSLKRLEELLRSKEFESTVIGQVAGLRNELEGRYDDPESTLDLEDREELHQKSITWQHLLREDLANEQRIPVSNIGLLEADRLIENPQNLVDSPVWNWLDERPKSDLREACKTLVIGCSTSSVMLSLRAVEHCLREWYQQENEPLEAAWGHVLDQLMEEYVEDEKKNDTVLTQLSDLPPVLSNLYYLKEKRNEVNHPDESPDEYEAQRTLMIVASTISDIYEEMDTWVLSDDGKVDREEMERIKDIDFDVSESDDIYDVFYKAIRDMDRNSEEGAPKSAIYDFGKQMDLGEDQVDEILKGLLYDGKAYEPSNDRMRPI